MSDLETVARPYSRAVFELASEQKDLAGWSDLLQLASTIAVDESMQAVIASPDIAATDLSDLFVSVMASVDGAPEIGEHAKNLISLLAENDRLLALPQISEGFDALKQEAEGTIEVLVTSARKLTAAQQKEITTKMKKRLGKEVSITAEIDESLIAGAIIKAGDLVIDGSARGKLGKLTTQLNK
jgi:F-type H+-transporting ATPase subunit delta